MEGFCKCDGVFLFWCAPGPFLVQHEEIVFFVFGEFREALVRLLFVGKRGRVEKLYVAMVSKASHRPVVVGRGELEAR